MSKPKTELEKVNPREVLMEAVKQDLENVTAYLETLLPQKGAVDRFKRMTLTAIMRDPKLLEANRKSLLLALIWCATKEMEPGVDDGVWLIPFKGIVVPIPAYKGLIKRATETDSVADVQAYGVYDKDDFDYCLGMDPVLSHKPPKLGVNRGQLIGAYVIVTKPDGTKRFEVIDRETAEKIRNAGAAWKVKPGEGPWADWEDQMFLKTVIKRGLKQIPVKAAFRDLINDDNRLEGGASVAALLEGVRGDLPAGLMGPEEDEPKAKEPNTDEFDRLVFAALQGLTIDETETRMKHLQESLTLISQTKNMTIPQFKEWVAPYFHAVDGDAARGYWPVFLAWEMKKYPVPVATKEEPPAAATGGAEPGVAQEAAAAPPEVPPETVEDVQGQGGDDIPFEKTAAPVEEIPFEERQTNAWNTLLSKGISMKELMEMGIERRTDITVETIEDVEKFAVNYKPAGKGKGKK